MSESMRVPAESKACTKCGETQSLAEYVVGRDHRVKVVARCRSCRREVSRAWYQRNREYHKSLRDKWRDENPDYQREYYLKNRQRLISAAVEYAKINPPDPAHRRAYGRERYARRKETGEKCSIVGCERVRKNKTNVLCDAHDKRRRESGRIGGDLRERLFVPPGTTCASRGCNEPHYAKRLCRPHYWALHHQENPELANLAAQRRRAMLQQLPAERYQLADIIERDGAACVLCGDEIDFALRWPNSGSMTVEHLECISWPGSAGDVLDNVSIAHLSCNIGRGNRPHPAAARKRAELLAET